MATVKQKKAIAKLAENGGNVSKAMIDAGYSPMTAKTPQKLTESAGFMDLVNKYLPDARLAFEHAELLNQTKLEYFVFPKKMDDKEIKGHVEAAGLRLIVVRSSDRGKLAFYSMPDAQARQKAIDMAYKLKGVYAPEKTANINLNLKGDIKDHKGLEEVRLKYEEELKAKLMGNHE